MDYIFDNERPIYIQLAEGLKIDIISGILKPGERIPSVREYALKAKVNPNTMQKALTELEREQLIYTERTNGKYVTTDKKIIEKLKTEVINQKLDNFLSDMRNIGVEIDKLKELINQKGREE